MRNRAKFLLFCCFCLVSLTGRCEIFRGVTLDDGLSSLLVNSLYKDSKGFIWVGTDVCLDRFDGVSFKHYSFENGDVKRRRVNVILETKDGTLWTGNNLGLWRLNRKEDRLERFLSDTIDIPVYSLATDKYGTLYIGTDKGLYIHSEKALTHWMPDSNVLSEGNSIIDMIPDDNQEGCGLQLKKGYSCFPQPKEKHNASCLKERSQA